MQSLDAPASSLSLSQTSSDIWFGGRNLALLRTDIADCWLRKENSVRLIIRNLEQVVTHWNAIFQLVLCLGYLQTSLFITIYQTAVGIISPVEFANEASHIQYKLWESHDHTLQPVITYIYLCGQICASCLSYFSNCPSVMDQKRNWNGKLAYRTYIKFAFYHIQTVGA